MEKKHLESLAPLEGKTCFQARVINGYTVPPGCNFKGRMQLIFFGRGGLKKETNAGAILVKARGGRKRKGGLKESLRASNNSSKTNGPGRDATQPL